MAFLSQANLLETLQSLYADLAALCEHHLEGISVLDEALAAHQDAFKNFLDTPPRKESSREKVKSGKVTICDEVYNLNKDFQEYSLQLSDEVLIDEVEAAKLLIESQESMITLGRPLVECGLIRFHQQRKYLLDCIRLCIQLSNDDEIGSELQAFFEEIVGIHIFGAPAPGRPAPPANKKIVPRCMAAMAEIKKSLESIENKIAAAKWMDRTPPEMETFEFCRLSLLQQHENVAVILCAAIEKRHGSQADFESFLGLLKKADKYDHLLVHLLPVVGAYIRVYGSIEGIADVMVARQLDKTVSNDESPWSLTFLHAAIRAWWIAEYSGHYVEGEIPVPNVDSEKEDKERTKQFTEALKEGAFDFILSVAADVSTPEWQDPSRIGIRQWLQRKSPQLATESVPFADHFRLCLMTRLEDFADAFISNMPDVLRKLRVEEDEQRQLSQFHEQDLDLERFLVIISYIYEKRPDAADTFWLDSDSNLAGFMQWASRRASTPLVCAFCEMLQSITESQANATLAHEFLVEDNSHSGKMRRSQSLTWTQIFKELHFFTNKIRERLNPQQAQDFRTSKPGGEQAEAEPESAMLLECYLRLIAKLASKSIVARTFLLRNQDFPLVDIVLQLVSCHVPARLRACGFYALAALITDKTQEDSHIMWECIDAFVSGGFQVSTVAKRGLKGTSQQPSSTVDAMFEQLGSGFEEPNAFIHILNCLISQWEGSSLLRDSLPFPENLGSNVRMPGVEPYVDFVLGRVFAHKSKELTEVSQLRVLRLNCLEFALLCLSSFNEDLIVLGNETSLSVDSIISTTDLATYVRLHPFARVMEWMFNSQVVEAIFNTIHQESRDIGSASPDSPLILGIIRAVQVAYKVLELQDTYLDLVRPVIKAHSGQLHHRQVPHAAYASFEEGFVDHLEVIADLGRYCGLGHAELTMASLKLLEKISTSSKLIAAWNPGPGRQSYRNKAVVALEKDDEASSIAGALISELVVPLDLISEANSSNYLIKTYIIDFLYECLRASPNQPTIAHLLLGFKCGASHLTVEARGEFEERSSLFHNLLRVLLETPFGDEESGMRDWLISLKHKILRVFKILWNSPLSSAIVLEELRRNEILFHLLLCQEAIQPDLVWDGLNTADPGFLLSDAAAHGFVGFLSIKQLTFDYLAIELCSVAQNRLPSLKRRIFEALNGQITDDEAENPHTVPTIFDLYDFMSQDEQWDLPAPDFLYFKDLDLSICAEESPEMAPQYNVERARQIVALKKRQDAQAGQIATKEEIAAIDQEQVILEEFLVYRNRYSQVSTERRMVLTSWVRLMLVMFESSEHQGSAKVAFLLQALQAILPSLEALGPDRPAEAYELSRLAKVLLFKLDFQSSETDKNSHAVGNLISEKLFQLFEICLYAIGRRAGTSELRSNYYAVCWRYLTGIIDDSGTFVAGRRKATKAIKVYGERLLNVICDDAFGGDPACQTLALVVLDALTNLGQRENDNQTVETLSRLNFVTVLVDSLKTILVDVTTAREGNMEQEMFFCHAKLSLLLRLSMTREGAKYVLQANLLRAIELSGLFAADPELQIDPSNTKALADHYGLLIKVMRVICAAIVSRGAHNVPHGLRFLTEHRMLIVHVLKRSSGIAAIDLQLEEVITELADLFCVLITVTGFVEFEESQAGNGLQQRRKDTPSFH